MTAKKKRLMNLPADLDAWLVTEAARKGLDVTALVVSILQVAKDGKVVTFGGGAGGGKTARLAHKVEVARAPSFVARMDLPPPAPPVPGSRLKQAKGKSK